MSTLTRQAPATRDQRKPLLPGTGSVLLAAAGLTALIWAVHRLSPRTLASFHGMLHAGIVEVLLRPGAYASLPPENPFFAGEPVAYYWFFHALAAQLVRLLGMNVFHALELLVLVSAGALPLIAAALGRRLYASTAAGLLIGYLVLAGANPLGVVFAAFHVLRDGPSVLQDNPDHLWGVVHPLFSLVRFHDVGGLNGPLISFFLNITSRPLALAGLLLAALALHRALRQPRPLTWTGFALAFALTTAFSPVIGIAAAGALGGALLGSWWWRGYRPGAGPNLLGAGSIASAAVAVLGGILLAAPTFYHLLLGPSSSQAEFFLFSAEGLWHLASVALSVMPLVVLAVVGLARAPGTERQFLGIMLNAGLLLLAVNLAITLPDGNGSNTFHAAAVLLAIPAAGAVLGAPRPGAPRSFSVRRAALIAGVFLPTLLAVLASYLFRPPLPATFAATHVVRTGNSDLAALYGWTRRHTPLDAVFVIDPRERVTVGGNIAEFPAFSGRSILVEQVDHYMVAPYPAAAARYELAIRLVSGEALGASDNEQLARLRRPVFIASDAAADPALTRRLEQLHGPPLFRQGSAAVYRVATAATPRIAERTGDGEAR